METIKRINELILNYKLEEASKLLQEISLDFFANKIISLAYKNSSLLYYSFIEFLINQNQNAEYHSIASQLLSSSLCHFNGAYQSAYFHALKAIELEPENIKYKEFILFFYEIPENILSFEKAQEIANEIIKTEPQNIVANQILFGKVA